MRQHGLLKVELHVVHGSSGGCVDATGWHLGFAHVLNEVCTEVRLPISCQSRFAH